MQPLGGLGASSERFGPNISKVWARSLRSLAAPSQRFGSVLCEVGPQQRILPRVPVVCKSPRGPREPKGPQGNPKDPKGTQGHPGGPNGPMAPKMPKGPKKLLGVLGDQIVPLGPKETPGGQGTPRRRCCNRNFILIFVEKEIVSSSSVSKKTSQRLSEVKPLWDPPAGFSSPGG